MKMILVQIYYNLLFAGLVAAMAVAFVASMAQEHLPTYTNPLAQLEASLK